MDFVEADSVRRPQPIELPFSFSERARNRKADIQKNPSFQESDVLLVKKLYYSLQYVAKYGFLNQWKEINLTNSVFRSFAEFG